MKSCLQWDPSGRHAISGQDTRDVKFLCSELSSLTNTCKSACFGPRILYLKNRIYRNREGVFSGFCQVLKISKLTEQVMNIFMILSSGYFWTTTKFSFHSCITFTRHKTMKYGRSFWAPFSVYDDCKHLRLMKNVNVRRTFFCMSLYNRNKEQTTCRLYSFY